MLVFKTVNQAVTLLTFSADGARVAVAGGGKKLHVWNLTAAKHKRTVISELGARAVFLAFRLDGKLFAVTQYGLSVLHDPDTGATMRHQPDSFGWIGDLVAAPDFSAVYGTGSLATKWGFDGGLRRLWEERVPGYPNQYGLGGAVLTPDGEYVAAVSQYPEAALHTRDTGTGTLRAAVPLGMGHVHSLTLLSDGRTLVFLWYGASAGGRMAALMTGPLAGPFEVVRTDTADQFSALAAHPSGRWLAVGQTDGLVRVFDTHDWSEVTAYRWTSERVRGLTFSPDGLKAAAGFGPAGQFVVWDVDL